MKVKAVTAAPASQMTLCQHAILATHPYSPLLTAFQLASDWLWLGLVCPQCPDSADIDSVLDLGGADLKRCGR